MKTATYAGTPGSAALWSPWIAPTNFLESGPLLGICRKTHKLLPFDPWLLKQAKVIHSMVFLILGQKDGGKSTLLKALALRLSALQAGMSEEMRVRINDRRQEDGKPEYQAITEFLCSLTIRLEEMSVNILDAGMAMAEDEMIDIMLDVFAQSAESGMDEFQQLALQIAVYKMLGTSAKDHSSLRVLEFLVRNLQLEDVTGYLSVLSAETITQLGLLDNSAANQKYIEREFMVAAQKVAQKIRWVTHGPFGKIFGDGTSLRDALSQPMVTMDWSNVNPRARALLQSRFLRWQTAALARNDLGLVPHISIGDEEHEGFQSLTHVRAKHAWVKKARSYPTADFVATQALRDMLQAGAEGSEIRTLSSGIVQGTGAYFIGRQPPGHEDVLHELTTVLGLSDADAEFTTQMPPGCFALKVPDRAAIFFDLILQDVELGLVQTGIAGERMANRLPVYTHADIQRVAYEEGVLNLANV